MKEYRQFQKESVSDMIEDTSERLIKIIRQKVADDGGDDFTFALEGIYHELVQIKNINDV